MRHPTPPAPQPPPEQKPGRSLFDPSRSLGAELLERSSPTVAPTEENFRPRARQAADQTAADPLGVAERAKVIGVLRKAEEFMSTANPPPDTPANVRRALELASGRMGLTFGEYRALTDHDPELVELEREVIVHARRRWGGAASAEPTMAPTATETRVAIVETEETDLVFSSSIFDRLFVPVDFDAGSRAAVALALELRRKHGSTVCLFHAVESSGSDDWLAGIGSPAVGGDWVAESKERMRRFLAHVTAEDTADVEVRARVGSPRYTLSHEAHLWEATLVIAAASMHTRLLRSPAEKLVRELRLPVLVIPARI
jgi:nucleotide-binding universal stress UspA family protein